MLLFAAAFDCDWITEAHVDRFCRIDFSDILDPFAVSPGVGSESEGYDGDACVFGELHSDGVEVFDGRVDPSRCLGKDDNGNVFSETFLPALQYSFQIIPGIGSGDDDGVAADHDVLENGIFDQGLFGDEGNTTDVSDDAWEDE